jgi:ABC-type multidrug transport system ATPase subunit/pSer/pThr/pTyr-binding forkhead associated (FHA) protein
MKVRLTWQDFTTQNQQTLTLDLPIAIGRKQSDIPNEFEGHKITPLILDNDSVSRCHGFLFLRNNEIFFCDTSRYGSKINGQAIHNDTQLIQSGDLIKVGGYRIELEILQDAKDPLLVSKHGLDTRDTKTVQISASTLYQKEWMNVPIQSMNLNDRKFLSIGRHPNNDLQVNHLTVSQFHAQIKLLNNNWILIDLNSTNGTFLNGARVIGKQVLPVGSMIQIGLSIFVFEPNQFLTYVNQEGNLHLDAINISKIVNNNIYLLQDISLSIKPREFVVIAGVSGGGKSTLLDALNGFRPATNGAVLVNGDRLYDNFEAYRNAIGYVPQKDIIHPTLTVEQTLRYAAELRMPSDTSPGERRQRIEEVLDDLEIRKRRHVLVERLSGGQIKRVSMGVELLTKPSLFFLDEATSGLDPGTEREVMSLLRKLADQGRTILLITHATDNIEICDLVVFLAAGGRVAYLGPPQDAPSYFGVKTFNEIYCKVEKEESPEYWQQKYLQSSQYQTYVNDRQITLEFDQKARSTERKVPTANTQQISSWQQFLILIRRNLDILLQDRISLVLMLAIAPILGILDFFIWDRHMFDLTDGSPQEALTMLSILVINTILVGSLSSMREIVKERDIFRRERMVCLQITPYVFSKFVTGILISLYQAAIFLGFKVLILDMSWTASMLVGLYVTLLITTIGGMTMGLLVSALSPNQNVTPLLIILTLVPQITFGGTLVPLNTLPASGQLISNAILSRWGFETVVTLTKVGQDIATDPCFKDKTEEERNAMSETEQESCQCLGSKLFSQCNFPSIQSLYNPAVDEPEPAQPEKPGAFPTNPAEFDAYKKSVDQYQVNMDNWISEYSQWSEERQGAIGEAEGIINRFYNDFGSTFNVSVFSRWGLLSGIVVLLLLGILTVQRLQNLL